MSVEAELEESIGYTPLQRMRHSAAHVMAEAVLEIFPDAKLAIGPAIEDGFYYDFDLPRTLTPGDLRLSLSKTCRIKKSASTRKTPFWTCVAARTSKIPARSALSS